MIKASVFENILRFKILCDHLNEYVCNELIHFVGLPYIICDETQGEVMLQDVFGISQHLISFSFSWS